MQSVAFNSGQTADRKASGFQALSAALIDFVERNNVKSVCLVPGNAGDALIISALQLFIREHGLELKLIGLQDIADLKSRGESGYILNAAGNLTHHFKGGWQNLALARQEGLNVFVLPCSLNPSDEQWQLFKSGDVIAGRECRTVELASRCTTAEVFLSHDLTFYPTGEWWKSLVQDERVGCRDYFRYWRFKQYGLANGVFAWFDQVVRKSELSAYRKDREKTEVVRSRWNVDVSSWLGPSSLDSWEANQECAARLLYFLTQFKHVKTNRLHVAIACHILGISCAMRPNSYFKNEEVFKHSLAGIDTSVEFQH